MRRKSVKKRKKRIKLKFKFLYWTGQENTKTSLFWSSTELHTVQLTTTHSSTHWQQIIIIIIILFLGKWLFLVALPLSATVCLSGTVLLSLYQWLSVTSVLFVFSECSPVLIVCLFPCLSIAICFSVYLLSVSFPISHRSHSVSHSVCLPLSLTFIPVTCT